MTTVFEFQSQLNRFLLPLRSTYFHNSGEVAVVHVPTPYFFNILLYHVFTYRLSGGIGTLIFDVGTLWEPHHLTGHLSVPRVPRVRRAARTKRSEGPQRSPEDTTKWSKSASKASSSDRTFMTSKVWTSKLWGRLLKVGWKYHGYIEILKVVWANCIGWMEVLCHSLRWRSFLQQGLPACHWWDMLGHVS